MHLDSQHGNLKRAFDDRTKTAPKPSVWVVEGSILSSTAYGEWHDLVPSVVTSTVYRRYSPASMYPMAKPLSELTSMSTPSSDRNSFHGDIRKKQSKIKNYHFHEQRRAGGTTHGSTAAASSPAEGDTAAPYVGIDHFSALNFASKDLTYLGGIDWAVWASNGESSCYETSTTIAVDVKKVQKFFLRPSPVVTIPKPKKQSKKNTSDRHFSTPQ